MHASSTHQLELFGTESVLHRRLVMRPPNTCTPNQYDDKLDDICLQDNTTRTRNPTTTLTKIVVVSQKLWQSSSLWGRRKQQIVQQLAHLQTCSNYWFINDSGLWGGKKTIEVDIVAMMIQGLSSLLWVDSPNAICNNGDDDENWWYDCTYDLAIFASEVCLISLMQGGRD